MRRIVIVILILVCGGLFTRAAAQPAPQTARQALVEMFFGGPGSFQKHLPKATLAALHQVDDGSTNTQLQFFALIGEQMRKQGQLQVFESGSTLMVMQEPKTGNKFTIAVEKDDLRGDEDEIELSFQTEKNFGPASAHLNPRLTFLMKSEAGIWRMNEVSFRLTVPLADPQFLKAMVENIKERQRAMASTPTVAPTQTTTAPAPGGSIRPANESGAVASLRTILTAEVAYAAAYPNQGYTCFLSDMDGFGRGNPNEHQAMLIDSQLGSGHKNGYVFRIMNCPNNPVTQFQVTAVPAQPGTGRAFCGDESGVIRYSSDGSGETCLHAGRSLQ